MRRVLPSPGLSCAVALLWLLLNGSAAPLQVLAALLLGVALPLVAQRLRPQRARMRRPWLALRLAMRVLGDIVLANIEVARLILGPESAIRPGFVWIPLDIRNVHGIATMAGIITLTPGTLSAELSEDHRHLLVHCFNLHDAQDTVATIKRRYEAPLREIFP